MAENVFIPFDIQPSPIISLNSTNVITNANDDSFVKELSSAIDPSSSSINQEQQLISTTEKHLLQENSFQTNNNSKNSICESLEYCNMPPERCVSLGSILKSFNAPLSEEQAYSLIYQSVKLYRDSLQTYGSKFNNLRVPVTRDHFKIHKDGTLHIDINKNEMGNKCYASTQKKILVKIGVVVFSTLDYNIPADDDCNLSTELEELIEFMTHEDTADDEGIEHDSEDTDDNAIVDTKDLDNVLQLCIHRIYPVNPNDHYKAVCRALVTESLELNAFLQKVLLNDTDNLRMKADVQTSKHELQKLEFPDWARFWMQVIDELRKGVRLRKSNYSNRESFEYKLTPYEILMDDIRSKKYNLRKVMVNGDVPLRVKKDAQALIVEFIRSRAPLKKASERKLLPKIVIPTPREQLLDDIRKGRDLRPIRQVLQRQKQNQRQYHHYQQQQQQQQQQQKQQASLKSRLLPACEPNVDNGVENTEKEKNIDSKSNNNNNNNIQIMKKDEGNSQSINYHHQSTTKNRRRIIEVDFSLLQDDDNNISPIENSPLLTATMNGDKSLINPLTSSPSSSQINYHNQYEHSKTIHHIKTSNNSQNNNVEIGNNIQHTTESEIEIVQRRKKDTITHDEYLRFYDHAIESYDLANQCEPHSSSNISIRRHTIVGCQSNIFECKPNKPTSIRQSEFTTATTMNPLNPLNSMTSLTIDAWTKDDIDRNEDDAVNSDDADDDNIVYDTVVNGHIINDEEYLNRQYRNPIMNTADNNTDKNNTNNNNNNINNNNNNRNNNNNYYYYTPGNTSSFCDEKQWTESLNVSDRLALTLEEIVHIRSVMTKAELEGLPVGVRVKEDVEKRKVCFLCLRTRFTIFGQWGVQCKICQRTVCSKCCSKMRIPTEHFRNVPVLLLSPSLMNSPVTSAVSSPNHQQHPTQTQQCTSNYMISVTGINVGTSTSTATNILDDGFPKSLMERLLRPESNRKIHMERDIIIPSSSPLRLQHSTSSTPAGIDTIQKGILVESIKTENDISNRNYSLMTRSMEGPKSLPPQSPARPHSNNSTLDRRNRFARAFTLTANNNNNNVDQHQPQNNHRGEIKAVCNDCRCLVYEIIRASKQTRSTARNKAIRNLTLDLSPVYKRW